MDRFKRGKKKSNGLGVYDGGINSGLGDTEYYNPGSTIEGEIDQLDSIGDGDAINTEDALPDSRRSYYTERVKEVGISYAADKAAASGTAVGTAASLMIDKDSRSGAFGAVGRGAAFWAASIVIPALFMMVFIAILQSGLKLDHIGKITTGLRFGAFHRDLGSRVRHLQVVANNNHGFVNSANATYQRTRISNRLLRWSPNQALDAMGDTDFKIQKTGRSVVTGGKARIESIVDTRTGDVFDMTTIKGQARYKAVSSSRVISEIGRGTFLTGRDVNYIFKKSSIPFSRYRHILNDIRGGKKIRHALLDTFMITERYQLSKLHADLISNKNLPVLGSKISDEAADSIKNGFKPKAINAAFVAQAAKAKKAWGIANKVGQFSTLATYACTFRTIASQIEGSYAVRIIGNINAYAEVMTTIAQVKAGDMAPQVMNNILRMFDGFSNASTYKIATNTPVGQINKGSVYDFTQLFSVSKIHTMSVATVLKISDILDEAVTPTGTIGRIINPGGYVVGKLPYIGDKIAQLTSKGVDFFCNQVLTTAGQGVLVASEVIATIVAAVFSGGLSTTASGAAKVTAFQITKESIKSVTARQIGTAASRFVATAGATALFEYVFFDRLLTSMIENVSGLGPLWVEGEGAKNYAKTDMGAHYLQQSQCQARGCSPQPAAKVKGQVEEYLALERQHYSDRGLMAGLFDLSNPYSLATRTVIETPASVQSGATQVASLLSFNPASLLNFGSAKAETYEANMLYPGSTTVLGYNQDEITGENPKFAHDSLFTWIESPGKLDELREKYKDCTDLTAVNVVLADIGYNPDKNNPPMCNLEEGRRYKAAYADCLLVDQFSVFGTGTTSFYSENCSYIVPNQNIDSLEELTAYDSPGILLAMKEAAANPVEIPEPEDYIEQILRVAGDFKITPVDVPIKTTDTLATTARRYDTEMAIS